MANPVMKILMKWLSAIGEIIIKQITDYTSSEKFKTQVKSMIKYVVEKIVDIVMSEKKGVTE